MRSDTNQAHRLAGIDFMDKVFENEYAPYSYKTEKYKWNLARELSTLRNKAQKENDPSSAGMNAAILNFFGSLKDLHSRPIFQSNGGVWLGIHTKRVDGRYIIAWIDPSISKKYPIQIGDELLSFDGKPVEQEMKFVKKQTNWFSTPSFEQSFAELFLTYRATSDWPTVPTAGSQVSLELKRKNSGKNVTVKMLWMDDEKQPSTERCPFWGKTKDGYLPTLGSIKWNSPASHIFKSYIFQHDGRRYGFIRFHTYALDAEKRIRALEELDEVIQRFNSFKIEALVVDQTGNGGGNFVYGFSVLSRFANKRMRTPLQEYLIDKDRLVGFARIDSLKNELQRFSEIQSESDAQTLLMEHPLFKDNLNFIRKDLQAVKSFREFIGFFVKDAKSRGSRHLTSPHYQFQEWIEPSGGPRFTGPMFLLVDELNLSAAEYVAATLQDNGRAKLIGTTTAGAGGDQRAISTTSICSGDQSTYEFSLCLSPQEAKGIEALGLRGFTYTVTLGQRVGNGGKLLGPIENIGVTPDYEHKLSERDITSNFSDYRGLILKKISGR